MSPDSYVPTWDILLPTLWDQSFIHSFIQSPGSDKIRDYRGFCGRFEEGVVNSLEIGRLRDLGR
jgi:hypothetical protein